MKHRLLRNLDRFFIALLVLGVVAFAGYELLRPGPDPLAGYTFCSLNELHANQAITRDYQNYMKGLSADERKYAGPTSFFQSTNGQHAVVIEIDINGKAWYHALFYDKDNKRINVIKYVGYHYMS
jgi:hypothetical protein